MATTTGAACVKERTRGREKRRRGVRRSLTRSHKSYRHRTIIIKTRHSSQPQTDTKEKPPRPYNFFFFFFLVRFYYGIQTAAQGSHKSLGMEKLNRCKNICMQQQEERITTVQIFIFFLSASLFIFIFIFKAKQQQQKQFRKGILMTWFSVHSVVKALHMRPQIK